MLYFITMPKSPQDSQPASKGDVQRLDAKIDGVEKRLDAKIDKLEKGLGGKLDKLQNTLDGFVGRVDNLTIENQVGANQMRELREQVVDHEGRIKTLESS